jgi:ribonuclease BN (tRNA processing enzyme)
VARAVVVAVGLAACGGGGLGGSAGAGEVPVPESREGGGEAGDSTVVITLGTGTPYPDPARSGPATAVTVGDRVFLFDAGAGVMRQLNAAGLPISGPEATFITHLHSDHTLGYPDLVLTSWIMRRVAPLPVYGPPGLADMTGHLLAAWSEDVRIRIDGLERELPDVYRARVTEIGPGVVYDSAGVTVTAFRVDHGSWDHAFGFRLDAPDRSVVIAGDARPSASVVEAARGADVLVHEAYPEGRVAPEDRPGGELWPQYMEAFHTSGREVGEIAAAARPGLLVLTHVVFMGGTETELLEGVRAGGWDGPVVVAEDLGRY